LKGEAGHRQHVIASMGSLIPIDAADHRQLLTRGFPSGAPVVMQPPRQELHRLQAPRPVQPVPAAMPSSIAPLESVAKLVGLPTGCFPSFVFYATHLPFTVGRGAPHVRLWAHGDHAMVTEDMNVSRVHASIEFEPLSRTYEMRVLGKRGALVDGHACVSGSAMRLGSGSCVRIGEAEFCVLLPLAAPQGQPRPVYRGLPLPPLPHAGSELPPQLTLQQLAAHALVRLLHGRTSTPTPTPHLQPQP